MSPYEVAMRLIRQRGTALSEPEFIAAYLNQEARQAPHGSALMLSPYITDRIGVSFENFAVALRKMSTATAQAASQLTEAVAVKGENQ